MRRIMTVILCIWIALCALGCRKQPPDSSGTENASTQSQPEKPEPLFLAVLNNERAFYSASRKADVYLSDYRRFVSSYALLSLNADGQNDVAAVMFDDGNIVILRKSAGTVTGFDFGLHGMYRLNTDGSFYWSNDAGTGYGCSMLDFSENGCTAVELWRVEHGESGSVAHYAGDKRLSEQEFQAVSAQNSQESVLWIPWADFVQNSL